MVARRKSGFMGLDLCTQNLLELEESVAVSCGPDVGYKKERERMWDHPRPHLSGVLEREDRPQQ